jgi:hypothetical protein
VLNKTNRANYQFFIDILAHSTLNKSQVDRILGYIGEKPDDGKTPYLRWVIKSQKGLTLTAEQQKLLEGMTLSYVCRQTGPHSYQCGG